MALLSLAAGPSPAERHQHPVAACLRAVVPLNVEASATSLWVCSHQISLSERLRRFSQLHLRSVDICLRGSGITTDAALTRLSLPQSTRRSRKAMSSSRGWRCGEGRNANKDPTLKRWVAEFAFLFGDGAGCGRHAPAARRVPRRVVCNVEQLGSDRPELPVLIFSGLRPTGLSEQTVFRGLKFFNKSQLSECLTEIKKIMGVAA